MHARQMLSSVREAVPHVNASHQVHRKGQSLKLSSTSCGRIDCSSCCTEHCCSTGMQSTFATLVKICRTCATVQPRGFRDGSVPRDVSVRASWQSATQLMGEQRIICPIVQRSCTFPPSIENLARSTAAGSATAMSGIGVGIGGRRYGDVGYAKHRAIPSRGIIAGGGAARTPAAVRLSPTAAAQGAFVGFGASANKARSACTGLNFDSCVAVIPSRADLEASIGSRNEYRYSPLKTSAGGSPQHCTRRQSV
jgi:hypothetical protein